MLLRRASLRLYMVNIILPLFLLMGLTLLMAQLWFLEADVESEGLKSKRFLQAPLRTVLVDKNPLELPLWITFIILDNGEILYPDAEDIKDYLPYFQHRTDGMTLDKWTSLLVRTIPDQVMIVQFEFRGTKGLCFYQRGLLPIPLRVLQRPAYSGFLLFIALLFFSLGTVLMNSHHRNVQKLVEAARRFSRMDLELPIAGGRRNELSEVYEAMEETRLDMRENRKKASMVMASVTHDLKTPVTSMRVYLEALLDGVISERDEQKNAVAKVLSKAGMLEERIDEMLYLFKLISSDWSREDEIVGNPEDWLSELSELFKEECSLHRRQYSARFHLKGLPAVQGNRKMLSRGLHNLIDNACRYSRDDDKVLFTASYQKRNNSLLITVEDSGPGVEEEDREKIFEMFYRKDNGRNSRGMGIGLASVRYMIEDKGGSITYRKSKLGGACFTVRLPLASEDHNSEF